MNETPVPALDQAAFRQVWRRVMPQDRVDCPFTLEEGEAAPGSPALPVPAPPLPVPCLGEASLGELPCLWERMDQAAQARRVYQALEGRTGRRGRFSPLIAGKNRQLRRLAAACFLISGKKRAPAPAPATLPLNNSLALRERFRAEQMEAAALMDSANSTADPCLAQLYRELAGENHVFAGRVRELLEGRRT